MKKLLIIAAALVLASLAAAVNSYAQPIRDVHVIHFILDGTNLKAFNAALDAGDLPTVKKYFVDNGAVFTHGLSSFPTTSTTIYQSFATGLLPGNAGIPHLERFNRQTQKIIGYLTPSGHAMVNTDLINMRALTNPDVAEIMPPTTIFELLKGHPTAAVYSSFSRGATFVHPEKAPIRALWSTYVTGGIERIDTLAYNKVKWLFTRKLEDVPRYTLVGLYSSDVSGHKYGPQSPEVREILELFDHFLADFTELLERRGLADKTYIIVSADHGMHESGDLFELQKSLEEKGVAAKSKNPRNKNYTLYAANRGVASSHIYLKHDGSFAPIEDPEIPRNHPAIGGGTIDLIDLILKMDATDILVVRAGARKSRIFDKSGHSADIACYTENLLDYCSYTFDRRSGDPLGYSSEPSLAKLLDGEPHPSAIWRDATAGMHYPDAVVQLSQIFRDGRAGDMFISTRERFGFRKVKEGNHGSADEEDMRIPLFISGPTVKRGTFYAARPADIYALLIEWFGLSEPKGNHDSINPFEPVSEDALWQKVAAIEHTLDGNPTLRQMIGVSDFVKKEIFPVVKPAQFPKILALAREEASRRTRLVAKLDGIIKSLEEQKTGKSEMKVVDPLYLDDHLDIATRTREWALHSRRIMDDEVEILSKCMNPASGSCRAL